MYDVTGTPEMLNLGNQGESGITEFEFDVSSWLLEFPEGVVNATFIAPNTTNCFPVLPSQLVLKEGVLTVKVMHNMTSEAGNGSLNVRLVNGDDIEIRSSVYPTFTLKSHPASGIAPTNVEDWVNEAAIKIQAAVASTRYLHIKYSVTEPDEDEDLTDTPSAWIGICHTATASAPTSYLEYNWNPLNSIQSITRVSGDGSAGTTDTYRITFTDTTTQDFDITHGNGIASIVRTNGDGSPATVDTYTITFDSGATTTFPVTHGNGIASIIRTEGDGSEGTTDTYTITFNDTTTTTFTVTHGNDSYIHFKYSDYAEPTDGQMTDNPLSLYIGVCSNQDATAPTTAISYSWTKIKGETGDSAFYAGDEAPIDPLKTVWLDTDEPDLMANYQDMMDATEAANNNIIESVAFVGDDMVFTKADETTHVISGARPILTGEIGLTGATGADGMSAYAAAVLGGYNGSASEFYDDLGAVEGLLAELEGI